MTRIGVQGMMLREHFAADGAYAVLQRMAGLGYKAIEMSQVPMTEENVAQMERARQDFGIEFAAISSPLEGMGNAAVDALTTHYDKMVSDARRLGATLMRIPIMPFPAMASREALQAFIEQANEFATRLRGDGITLTYHNHHNEFAKYDGKRILDLIRDGAPDLRFEADLHWVHRAGVNPVTFLKDYAGLVDLIHLKDYRVSHVPAEAFELLAAGDHKGFMQAFSGIVQFAELGQGNLDFKAIIDTALETGVKWMLVEQDDLYGRDAFDCLETSRDHLLSLGYGYLF